MSSVSHGFTKSSKATLSTLPQHFSAALLPSNIVPQLALVTADDSNNDTKASNIFAFIDWGFCCSHYSDLPVSPTSSHNLLRSDLPFPNTTHHTRTYTHTLSPPQQHVSHFFRLQCLFTKPLVLPTDLVQSTNMFVMPNHSHALAYSSHHQRKSFAVIGEKWARSWRHESGRGEKMLSHVQRNG